MAAWDLWEMPRGGMLGEIPAHGFSEVSRVSPGSRASVTEAHTGEGLVIRKMLRSKMWNLLIQGWVMRGSYSNVRRP